MSKATIMHDADWLSTFRRKILSWYKKNARDLPWRNTSDPYKIWISEIMLQQTQVATVVDYYHRFLKKFPTVNDLANAGEQDVLSLWSGLGYYRRARQLHAAAKTIAEDYSGKFPSQFEQILSLPGIGRYTAGAISSFAFDEKRPILEANTIRLFARLLAFREATQIPESQKTLWHFAEQILPPRRNSGQLNQAVMELGSQVCSPSKPTCLLCPVNELCPTYEAGLQHVIPLPKPKKNTTRLDHGLVFIRQNGKVLLRQNEPGEWWEGLWDFPRVELPTEISKLDGPKHSQIGLKTEEALQLRFGLTCSTGEFRMEIKHAVTRYSIRVHCFDAELTSKLNIDNLLGKWAWAGDPVDFPLTATASKLSKSS